MNKIRDSGQCIYNNNIRLLLNFIRYYVACLCGYHATTESPMDGTPLPPLAYTRWWNGQSLASLYVSAFERSFCALGNINAATPPCERIICTIQPPPCRFFFCFRLKGKYKRLGRNNAHTSDVVQSHQGAKILLNVIGVVHQWIIQCSTNLAFNLN